jgi:hypothetical protein
MLSGIRSDSDRIKKQLEISTYDGRYQLNTPGPGINVGFIEDPHIRLQHWGCNLYHDRVAIENELSNRFSRRPSAYRPMSSYQPMSRHMNPAQNVPTIESRSCLPAWIFRDKESVRESISLIDVSRHDGPPAIASRLLPCGLDRGTGKGNWGRCD